MFSLPFHMNPLIQQRAVTQSTNVFAVFSIETRTQHRMPNAACHILPLFQASFQQYLRHAAWHEHAAVAGRTYSTTRTSLERYSYCTSSSSTEYSAMHQPRTWIARPVSGPCGRDEWPNILYGKESANTDVMPLRTYD